MKILVLGATGNVGSRFIRLASAAGHQVVAYARRPEAVPEGAGVSAVEGAVEDVDRLTAAARGADTVLVSITGSMREASFMQRSLPGILQAVERAGVRRILLVSVFGAGDTAEKASGFARLVYRTALGRFLADKAAADRLLQDSGLEWTIAYPVNLTDAPALAAATVKPLAEVGTVPGLPTLPMDNAAAALLDIITDQGTIGARLLITTPKGWRAAR